MGISKASEIVIAVVCSRFGLTRLELFDRYRYHELVYPRQIVMYCLYFTKKRFPSIKGFSSLAIADITGMNHATVFYSDHKITDMIQVRADVRQDVRDIVEACSSAGFKYPMGKFMEDVNGFEIKEKFK